MKKEENSALITGIGVLTPIGNSPTEMLASLRGLRDGIAPATKIDTSKFSSRINAEVKKFDAASSMSPQELETFSDPFLRLAICAARAALKDADVKIVPSEKSVALVFATCNAGMNSAEIEYKSKLGISDEKFDRRSAYQSEFYAPAKALCSALNINGEAWIVNTACSGSTAAIALAENLIESGFVDAVLVGGADAMSLANYAGFSAIKVVSPQKIAPFSNPSGMNIGEGAVFWFMESSSSAAERGAKVYGKVIGNATSGDAHHPTQPDPRGDGAFRTMRDAAKNAGVSVDKIACINAHGSGTLANDKAEAKGIAKFLNGAKVPVTSTKSYTGHCMGATGIIEATCQLLSMNDNFIPPTIHFDGLRAGCEIEPVIGNGLELEYDCFLSANYAFAGNNAAIVVAKKSFSDFQKPKIVFDDSVVISGLGAISSLGIGVEKNLEELVCGTIGIKKISRFASDRMAGLVDLPNLRSINKRIDFSGMNRISIYATAAAAEALQAAQLRVSHDKSEEIGLTVAVSRGSCESEHMLGVFADSQCRGDIACFSNVTANSTAGWVSKALEIKGANITLTSGLNSGIQTVEYAAAQIRRGVAKQIVALAADELYAQQMEGYEKIGYLKSGRFEEKSELDYSFEFNSVLGEGAAALVVESRQSALSRAAEIFGEILSCATAMDVEDFYGANIAGDGLQRAVNLALERAKIQPSEIELLVWSPRGCAQDSKIINLRDSLFSSSPIITTVFNTGYIETSSSLLSLVCVLKSLAEKTPLWTQKTGVKYLDEQPLPADPKKILFLSSSFSGNNHALIVKR